MFADDRLYLLLEVVIISVDLSTRCSRRPIHTGDDGCPAFVNFDLYPDGFQVGLISLGRSMKTLYLY